MSRRSQRCQTRGRRALCWGLAIFFAVQLGVGVALDFLWPNVRFATLTHILTALRRWDHTPDVICLGSSRIGTTFRPQVIQAKLREMTADGQVTTFNAAVDSADLTTAEFVLARLLEDGARPKVIILEVSPEGLSARNRWLSRGIERHWTWKDVATKFGEVWRRGGYHELIRTRIIPVFAFRDSLCRTIFGPLAPAAQSGESEPGDQTPPNTGYAWEQWMAARSADPTRESIPQALRGFGRQLQNYRVGGGPARALEGIVRRCREHDISVVLMATPVCSDQRRFYTPEIDAAFVSYLRPIVEDYDCQFVDYRDRLPDALLIDNHHATCDGGEVVSGQFVEELLAPVWLARTLGPRSGRCDPQMALRGTPSIPPPSSRR